MWPFSKTNYKNIKMHLIKILKLKTHLNIVFLNAFPTLWVRNFFFEFNRYFFQFFQRPFPVWDRSKPLSIVIHRELPLHERCLFLLNKRNLSTYEEYGTC